MTDEPPRFDGFRDYVFVMSDVAAERRIFSLTSGSNGKSPSTQAFVR